MRIAILTSARSGSTSLYHIIEKQLLTRKYYCISEPFNKGWREPAGLNTYDIDYFEDKQDIFIKTFVSSGQKPTTFVDDEHGYWKWFFDYFEKVIILDYFGLSGTPRTLEDIGSDFNLTKERVRQIKEKALRKLRNESSALFDYM